MYTAIGICNAGILKVGKITSVYTVGLSETCSVLYQNKFEKQCISLAFIIRI